ncbi:MAG: hypothetical protein R2856_34195 [Caldilineaceae bacterium]
MMIAAGDALTQQRMGPFRANVAPAAVMAPQSFDAFRLEQIRAGLSCSPGLAIGTTGLFVTGLSGEITLIPGGERVDVTVTIEAGKSLPGIGPILAVEGSMGVQPRPFELDLGVALSVLSISHRTEAKVTTNSFRASIQFEAIFFNGSAEINAFTRNGRATFTGSARVSLEVRKGSDCKEQASASGRIRLCPPPIPPFSTGKLATVGADMGEFTNGNFGFKGFIRLFGTHGFFIDHRGNLKFGNVNRFQLIDAPAVAAARISRDALSAVAKS